MERAGDVEFSEVQREGWSAFRVFAVAVAALVWVGTAGQACYIGRTPGDWSQLGFVLFQFVLMGVLLPLVALYGRFRATVRGGSLDLRRSTLGLAIRKRSIPLDSIESAELGSCYPNIDHGSWATHSGGPSGVRLHLRDGEIVLVASERPAELLAAVRSPAAARVA